MSNNRGNTGIAVLVAIVIIIVLLIAGWFVCVEIDTVGGNEVGVIETWGEGVDPAIYPSKTYFLFPNWSKDMYRYSLSPQIFVMNHRKDDERANGRPNDSYIARSSDNQALVLDLALQWHYDQTKIIDIHKRYKTHVAMKGWDGIIEERVIRQNLMLAVNTEVTSRKAIDVYSGEGFVATQTGIAKQLTDPAGELRQQGIIIESFVIEKISFEDNNYILEINKRQVAQQRELRANAEEKAAMAESLKAKAEAQSDYEKRVVEATRDKQVQVLASEANAQQQINAATAQARQVEIAAEANRKAAEANAAAILAVGKAEAEAQKLKLSAYAVPGADAFVRVEISKQLALAFGNIKGYLPGDMKVNLLSGNFMDAVNSIVGQRSEKLHEPKP